MAVACGAAIFAQPPSPAGAAPRTVTLAPPLVRSVPAQLRRVSNWIDARYERALAQGTMPVVYLSQETDGTVVAYPSTSATPPTSPVETISGLSGPSGLAVDALGNLYVAEHNAADVKVFPPGSTKPAKTLVGIAGVGVPAGVAVDARGTIYVEVNATTAPQILVYAHGSTTPTSTLSDPSIVALNWIAVDAAGNVLVTYIGSGDNSYVGAFPASTSLGASLGVSFFHQLAVDSPQTVGAATSPFDLAFDKNGDLVVSDNGVSGSQVVGVYAPAVQKPARSMRVGANGYNGFNLLALTGPQNRHLLVAPEGAGILYRYAYATGALEQTIPLPVNFVNGIATSPAAPVGGW